MARTALDALALARILFIPTGEPRYRARAVASGEHRIAMLRLAIQGEPRYPIDARELARAASGYTVDTLRSLHAEMPQAELVLLIGGDQYAKFGEWREPEEIGRLARIAVFARPGFARNTDGVTSVPFAPMPVSASEIRSRASRGDDIADVVPPAVASYISSHGLYR